MVVADKHKMTDEEKAMYTGICMSRNTEVTLRWSRSQMLIFVNLAALPFLNAPTTKPFTYYLLGVTGILLSGFWFLINWRTQKWIDYWQTRLALIDPPPSDLLEFRMFGGTAWEEANKFPNFYHILNGMPFAFFCMWATVLAYASYVVPRDEFVMRIIIGGN